MFFWFSRSWRGPRGGCSGPLYQMGSRPFLVAPNRQMFDFQNVHFFRNLKIHARFERFAF